MESFVRNVARTIERVERFSVNTRKSVARLTKASEIRARLESLETRWREFEDAWNNWQAAADAEKQEVRAFLDDVYDEIDEQYSAAKAELFEMQDRVVVRQQAAGQVDDGDEHHGAGQANIRLPAIQPPSFAGEWEEWVSFRDVFSALVIRNTSISDTHRLHLLRVACTGPAAEEIEGIEMAEGNFRTAWEALVKRYENERLIVFRLIERMLNIPAMTRECAVELSKLLNGTNHCIRALGVLKRQTANLDDLLVVLTVTKLDVATRTAWERSLGAKKAMPTYKELDEFLCGVLGSLEALKNVLDTSANKTTKNTYQASNNSANFGRVARTHVVATNDRGCLLCQAAHGLYNCSQFLAMSVADLRTFVEEKRICFNCIGSTNHRARQCMNKYVCRECKASLHTLLHIAEAPVVVTSDDVGRRATPFDAPSRSVSSNVCQLLSAGDSREALLPTAWVKVTTPDGRSAKLRALIDQGSQVSLISRQAVQKLGLKWRPTKITLSGVAEAAAGKTYGSVQFSASACIMEGDKLDVCALVLSTITADLPNVLVKKSVHPVLATLRLADEQYWLPGRVDVLLGSSVFAELLLKGVRKADGLVAQETIFGWMLSGNASSRPRITAKVTCTHIQLDGLLQRFWEQEEMQRKPLMSVDDERCETIYNSTTRRGDDGRYIVELPFRQGGRELGESQKGAIRRLLQMEKKGEQHPNMFTGYRLFMKTYLELGHMERISDAEIELQPHCYLPHHAVFKPDSTTTKLRVVFDATAATASGRGLNALLLTGPRLQETLTAILMRWRMHKIAFSADIEKMYRQIWVEPKHQEYQRIVWRESVADPIGHYRLKTVTYGTASAPYMAVKTIQRLADDEEKNFPMAEDVVRNDFYVDDCMSGAHSVKEAQLLKDELLGLMTAGGLRLLKWSSNSKELLQTLPEDHVECRAPLRIDEDESIKALGVHWHPSADELGYRVYLENNNASTKRQMLSEIAKLFDPLGLLAPVIITAKTTMQQLWLTGLRWDEELPEDVLERWRVFQRELPQLQEIRVKRWFGCSERWKTVQLHGFSDASTLAYAACVYVRVQQPDGSVMVTLVAAKTKVAPIKQQSVPRLELNGAVLLTRLLGECRLAIKFEGVEMFAWTDSTVVLAWIRRHANVWPTFIANRVSESSMNATQWLHVPGVDNPADVASRGIMPSELRNHPLWWTGPKWLREERGGWPMQDKLNVDESQLEVKKVVATVLVQKKDMWMLVKQYSTWARLLRVTAYCRRLLPAQRQRERSVQADEIEAARKVWLRLAQKHDFGEVTQFVANGAALRKHSLQKLRPFVDDNGLLRVGGRLANSNLTYDEEHPVILCGKNEVSWLLIKDAHERVFHSGPQNTIGVLHQRYWLLNERRQVRSFVHQCVTCAKARPRMQTQRMGELPAARVQPSRPFLHTAIDYAGPVWSRTSKGRGHKAFKSWIAVFVCLSTKAVHLELVSELSSAAFIAAFQRFTARRGVCSDVYCDNGTNFVGADREMRQHLAECMRDDQWRWDLAMKGTRFHFSPPGSPHFNGLAESTVRMAKSSMYKVIGDSRLIAGGSSHKLQTTVCSIDRWQ